MTSATQVSPGQPQLGPASLNLCDAPGTHRRRLLCATSMQPMTVFGSWPTPSPALPSGPRRKPQSYFPGALIRLISATKAGVLLGSVLRAEGAKTQPWS